MKNILYALSFAISLVSCANTQKLAGDKTGSMENENLYTDSVIASLQQNNDLVLANVVEANAWGQSATYQIITKKGEEWTGYFYYVNLMESAKINGSHPYNINPVLLPKEACEAVLKSFEKNNIAAIKGDGGKDFCGSNPPKNCNINDGTTSRLLWLTKTNIINPSFYEPVFYESCCPGNSDRKKFIEVMQLIQNTFEKYGHGR
ncbi:MAG: hypothetical protein JSS67_11910 [Bacteroidetes bacterium]|nr:hypothetical protein [Bacteroidota bacterium]